MVCLSPIARGARYHTAAWRNFWTNLTREKLLAAGMSYLRDVAALAEAGRRRGRGGEEDEGVSGRGGGKGASKGKAAPPDKPGA